MTEMGIVQMGLINFVKMKKLMNNYPLAIPHNKMEYLK